MIETNTADLKVRLRTWYQKPESKLIVAFAALVVIVAMARLVPHPYRPFNFAPVGALGLFAGAYAKTKWSWAFPLAALFAADLFIGFYSPVAMLAVYGGFAVAGLIGRKFLSKSAAAPRIGMCALGSATAFFVISNFGVWLAGGYPRSILGIVECYTLALPFFRNTLYGDLFFSAVLFGAFALARNTVKNRKWLGQPA
ncbi:MAG: hypothetical protein IH945_07345 [Armatimonadetes bacterium]|nr:hypothetical protein [Armatimonadota bacterium]